MPFFRDWVLHNGGLKLVSLGIAFLLWATYMSEPIVEVGYAVPLEFRNLPRDLEIAGDVPTQVHVRARGRSALLRRLTPSDLEIAVDLGGRTAGEVSIPLTPELITAPYGAKVVRITPAQIRMKLVRSSPASPGPAR